MSTSRAVFRCLPLVAALACATAHAQGASALPPPGDELKRLCTTIAMTPADAREAARRAECVLAGALPSPNRFEEARNLARWALSKGDPAGGLMLFVAFQDDPANQYVKNGVADSAAYARLAARSIADRREQIDAIEGLGFAASRSYPGAGTLLAAYFHDTLAPRNVSRLGALTGLLIKNGEHPPVVERFAREADAIARDASGTRASARAFFEAYGEAAAAAKQGFREQSGGQACEDLQLKSVSAGELQGAEFLPLTGTLVVESYLVRGGWSEFWTFRGCGQEVPVKVTFEADGWGGSRSSARYNRGT